MEKTFMAFIGFILVSVSLMLLATNVEYYLGDTVIIMGVAWNWSTLVTIMLTVSVFPFAYLFLNRSVKRLKK